MDQHQLLVYSKAYDTNVQESACQMAAILWETKHVYNGFSDNSTRCYGSL